VFRYVDEHVVSSGAPHGTRAAPDFLQRIGTRTGVRDRCVRPFAIEQMPFERDVERRQTRRPPRGSVKIRISSSVSGEGRPLWKRISHDGHVPRYWNKRRWTNGHALIRPIVVASSQAASTGLLAMSE
jgi:hypothetical protein